MHDLRFAAAPLQVVMCGCKWRSVCEIHLVKCAMCVHAVRMGEFSGVQSAITILQFSLRSLNRRGPDSLIFFNEHFIQSSNIALKINAFQPNNGKTNLKRKCFFRQCI